MASDDGKRCDEVLAQLDAIEREMKRIGFWSGNPPDLQSDVATGKIRSFLEAPSFELWLQCVLLPNARAAAREGKLPAQSQVGLMALRHYDCHTHVEQAQTLLQLLREFDAIVVEGQP